MRERGGSDSAAGLLRLADWKGRELSWLELSGESRERNGSRALPFPQKHFA